MLPKQILYAVEQYKFEAVIIFYFAAAAFMLPLIAALNNLDTRYATSSPASAQVETFSHTNVDPDRPIAIRTTALAPLTPINAVSNGWPLHGQVTTEYGVPHRPWQDTHTGIDISSGQRSGNAAITAYKDGIVVSMVRSSSGLGNHVVIDHGEGYSSVYAHLYSTKVVNGQQVRAGEIVGTEGRSGAATGPHLHFEIRFNGSPVDPRGHIPQNP